METQRLCFNCFASFEGGGVCPLCGFDLAENMQDYPVALWAGALLEGRYLVGRVLGQGGFGITYLALDMQLDAKVAIKEFMPSDIATRIKGTTVSVFSGDKSQDFDYGSERFLDEARTLAKFIGNPNIAGVSNYFSENGTSYFVMDYVEGISFKSYIASRGGNVSVEDTLNVMIPVLRALTAVHREGFVHRDVTPDNIYITHDGIVKLLDFGSARYSIGDKSKSLDVVLKVGYAPKEQYIRRGKQGAYTDVYSCAACFYAAITGFLPPESLERLERDEIAPISAGGIEIAPYLEYAIMKGLAVQAEDRFQTAEEFLRAIEERQLPKETPKKAVPSGKKPKILIACAICACLGLAIGVGALLGGGEKVGDEPSVSAAATSPLLTAEVPTITIAGEQYSTDLTALDLRSQGLTDADLAPLRYMINLTSLNLRDNDISDISPLSGLGQLKELYLYNTQVSDISAVAALVNLQRLEVSGGDISDLSPLQNLTELVHLRFSGGSGGTTNTSISNLSPLCNLVKLESLSLPANTAISDLSPLSAMVNLQELHTDGNWGNGRGFINDLSPLSGLTSLRNVSLQLGDIDSLSPLAELTELASLRLHGSIYYDDLSPISGMKNLETLELYGSGNTSIGYTGLDLSAFSELTGLKTIRIHVDGLSSLEGLENLTGLQSLSIYGQNTTLENLDPLINLSELREIYLPMQAQSFTQYIDISGLTSCTELQSLRMDRNILDLAPLSGLKNLRTLEISNGHGGAYRSGQYSSLEPLRGLINLTDLSISNENITDISALADLANLRTLSLYCGQLRDISPLRGLANLQSLSAQCYNITDWSPVDHVANVTRN